MIPDKFWTRIKTVQRIHQRLYDAGKGWIVGWLILLLRHTGRKSGRLYATPLQYERIDGAYYVGAGRGPKADWFRNVQANPRVEVSVGRENFEALAEAVTDPERVADFLAFRLKRHPLMIGLMMKAHALPMKPSRAQLLGLARATAVVILHPLDRLLADTQSGYDAVAKQYAQEYFHELQAKPRDRQLLDRLIAEVGSLGPICDMGCGPGEVARYLKDRGANALGVDLSPQMIAAARRLSPDIPFQVGNMLALDVPDSSWGGIAAFYVLIHIPRPFVVDALRAMKRLLKPGGALLVTFHTGDEVKHITDWWEKKVSLDFAFFPPEFIESCLRQAGFERIETTIRGPYPDVEYQSRRAYIFARKPRGGG